MMTHEEIIKYLSPDDKRMVGLCLTDIMCEATIAAQEIEQIWGQYVNQKQANHIKSRMNRIAILSAAMKGGLNKDDA
jgi:hypothetical protein